MVLKWVWNLCFGQLRLDVVGTLYGNGYDTIGFEKITGPSMDNKLNGE